MSWDLDDDFERDMLDYSEIETIHPDQAEVPLPKSILQYQRRIQSNNSTSIFDADYTMEWKDEESAAKTSRKGHKRIDEDMGGVFKDEKVTYVVSGRGRGGRNLVITPGEPSASKVNGDDDEIIKQIRKVAPVGYSNEITENLVRAHKMSKIMEQNATSSPDKSKVNSPNISMSNSPIISKSSSPAVSKSGSDVDTVSNSKTYVDEDFYMDSRKGSPRTKTTRNRDVDSGKSTPYVTASDIPSSEYYSSQDGNESFISKSSTKDDDSNKSEDEHPEATAASHFVALSTSAKTKSASEQNYQVSEENEGAIPKKPLPLSEMLRKSREAHKKKQLELKQNLVIEEISSASKIDEEELATQQKIQEILRQDRVEMEEMRKKRLSEKSPKTSKSSKSSRSSNSSLSSREEFVPWRSASNSSTSSRELPWRRRTNSPPRYPWGEISRKKENQLNINSIEDFPALK